MLTIVAALTLNNAVAQPFATNTTVSSGTNPSAAGATVSIQALIASPATPLAATFAMGFGASSTQLRYIRYDLSGATFASTVVNANLVDATTAGNITAVALVQGGQVGDSFVLFTITTGASGIPITDQLTFNIASVNISSSASATISYSQHGSAASGAGSSPPNTAVLAQGGPVALSTISAGPALTGTVSFTENGSAIAGCSAVVVSSSTATCSAIFSTAGTRTIAASYSGDANYLTSSGTLTGGQVVRLAITPSTLSGSTYGTPIAPVTFAASGGTAPYTFAITGGSLPGYSLSGTGVLSGTPTAAGSYNVTITVTDSGSLSGSVSYAVTVAKATQVITFSLPTSGLVGAAVPLSATSNSGLTVAYSVSTPLTCLISGSTLAFSAAGSCTVVASQSGNANYNAATDVSATVAVTQTSVSGPPSLLMRFPGGTLLQGTLVNSVFQFTSLPALGQNRVLVAWTDLGGDGTRDLVFQDYSGGDFAEIRSWRDMLPTNETLLRSVKPVWQVQAIGDLDGDGFGDLVWRYNVEGSLDTGVSYIWFTNGTGVTQVKKRGGAPLNWTLLGAADLNGDHAADMVYLSPVNALRVLMATPNRTCANLSAGSVPADFRVLKFADFTGNGRGDLLIHNIVTGELRLISLNASGLTLPAPTAASNDANASCTSSALTIPTTSRVLGTISAGLLYLASGDFNGDGIADVAFRNSSGGMFVLLMSPNGAAPTVIQNAGSVPAGYQVFQP